MVFMNTQFSDAILNWYDNHARILPWRVSPAERLQGILPNPYYVWLSEMMLQQTTVATVKDYYHKFITKWTTIHALAATTQDDIMTAWAGLGYYSRARNLHKTAQIIVNDYQGIFPNHEKELIKLAGIGRYSAASIAAIAFDESVAVMDGNIERIIARLYCVKTPMPIAKNELYQHTKALTPPKRAGDYAQAMMDLGATICTPKKPICNLCPVKNYCMAYRTDIPENYPVKTPKSPKPTHKGIIYLIIDKEQNILVQKRPDKGLFGGMEIFPYINPHEHTNDDLRYDDNVRCNTHQVIGCVKHIFTHFTFIADIILIKTEMIKLNTPTMRIIPVSQLHTAALPTLMQKAIRMLNY
jgi:A/G-specific adenine glycosylase